MEDQANLLPVKIQYHEENRRFRFNALNTLAAFRQQAYSLFRIPAEIQTVLYYWDGEDWIVVEQEDEWVETKRLMLLGAGVAKPEMVFKLKLQDRMPDWTKNAQNALSKIETVVKEAAEKIVKAEVVQRVVASVQREIEQEDSQVRRHVDQIIEDVKDGLKFIVDDLNASLGASASGAAAGAASSAPASASSSVAAPAAAEVSVPAAAAAPVVVEEKQPEPAPAAAQIPKGLAESWSFVEIQQENQLAEQPIVSAAPAPAVVPAAAASPSPVPIHPVPVKSPSPVVFMDAAPSVIVAEHVTMPHGAEAVVGNTFVKTWKLQNNGQVQWPNGTMMAYVSGPAPQIIQLKFLTRLPQLLPGETSDVSVEMTAPTAPGQYRGAFRLADRHGQCFGEPFDFVINVIPVPAPVIPVHVPVSVPAVPEVPIVPAVPAIPVSAPLPPVEIPVPSKWALQLEQLHAMGFSEDDKNIQVLDRVNGDIQQAVLYLIGALN